MALNRACVGKEYPPIRTTVTLDAIENYARACNDDNPCYFDHGNPRAVVAPPIFGATAMFHSLLAATGDPEAGVDVMRLVHSEQDVEFFRPIRPGDEMVSHSRIASIETRATGEAMAIRLTLHNAAGELVQRAINTIFIRGPRSREAKSSRTQDGERSRGEPIVNSIQRIDPDQAVRYAAASGDRNPIHLDEGVARMVGLPGVIIHGLCTMAFVARVIVDGPCGGDPDRLKRMSVRFSRPVHPGVTIETTVWNGSEANGRKRYLFETRNGAGHVVISDGIAESIGDDGRSEGVRRLPSA